jgi:hypothetical protein
MRTKNEMTNLYNEMKTVLTHTRSCWCENVECEDCTAMASGGCLRDNLDDVMQYIADKNAEEDNAHV